MDLNELLFWSIIFCTALVPLSACVLRQKVARGWRIVTIFLLTLALALYILFPAQGGYFLAGIWILVFIGPVTGVHLARYFGRKRQFSRAKKVAQWVRILHPFDEWRELAGYWEVKAILEAGQIDKAERLCAEKLSSGRLLSQASQCDILAAKGEWQQIGGLCASLPNEWQENSLFRMWHLRALMHEGSVEKFRDAFLIHELFARNSCDWFFLQQLRLLLLSLAGCRDMVESLLESSFRGSAKIWKQYWRCIAALVAQPLEDATGELERLKGAFPLWQGAHLFQKTLRARLDDSFKAGLLPVANRIGAELAAEQESYPAPQLSRLWAVALPALLCLFFFFLEVWLGTSTSFDTLERLGASYPTAVFGRGEWWRLVTAPFLHYGIGHLLFNLLALLLIGGLFSTRFGPGAFLLLFFPISFLSLFLPLITSALLSTEIFLVGMSGGILGVLGANWAAARESQRKTGSVRAAIDVRLFGVIILGQVLFDFFTPEISQFAHLSGLVLGYIVFAYWGERFRRSSRAAAS